MFTVLGFFISYDLFIKHRGAALHGRSGSRTLAFTCDLDHVLVIIVASANCYSCFQIEMLQQPLPELVIPDLYEVTFLVEPESNHFTKHICIVLDIKENYINFPVSIQSPEAHQSCDFIRTHLPLNTEAKSRPTCMRNPYAHCKILFTAR